MEVIIKDEMISEMDSRYNEVWDSWEKRMTHLFKKHVHPILIKEKEDNSLKPIEIDGITRLYEKHVFSDEIYQILLDEIQMIETVFYRDVVSWS
tara:strand:- start:468 stop:749 length:282 start_codon:yes stop_codon:yes gene_type:complete